MTHTKTYLDKDRLYLRKVTELGSSEIMITVDNHGHPVGETTKITAEEYSVLRLLALNNLG